MRQAEGGIHGEVDRNGNSVGALARADWWACGRNNFNEEGSLAGASDRTRELEQIESELACEAVENRRAPGFSDVPFK